MEGTKFNCLVDQCSKIYSSVQALNRHIKDSHSFTPRRKFKCDLCSIEYFAKSYLHQHVQRIHSGSYTKFGCSFCDAEFTSKQGRDKHVVATHTGEKTFPCVECPAKFSTSQLLKRHQYVHSEEKLHKCTICSKQFKRRHHLTSHIKNLHSPRTKDFECSTCQKTFFTKPHLKQHAKTHSLRGGFSCYFCKKEFAQRAHLESHLRIHTQEKPFFCPEKICQYSCPHPTSLRLHKRRHHPSPTDNTTISSKTWSCYFCSKVFSQHNDLVMHMRSHSLEEPFSCGLCQKSFKEGNALSYHISSHTKETPYSCPHCQKCFSRSGTLKRHVAIHTGERRFFFVNFAATHHYKM